MTVLLIVTVAEASVASAFKPPAATAGASNATTPAPLEGFKKRRWVDGPAWGVHLAPMS